MGEFAGGTLSRPKVQMVGIRRFLAVLAAVLAVVQVLVVPRFLAPRPAHTDAARITEAADPAAAFAAARSQGEPVVVTSLTTPTRQVSAKPDGSYSAELTTVPVRTRRGQSWTPIDPRLTAGPGGALVPRAADASVAFSGGGDRQPLVTFGAPGASFALTWPGALPRPVVDGATATYPDVLPGVDLQLTAGGDGFTQHVVVRSSRAAHDPRLSGIRLGLTTDGLTVRTTAQGGVQAVDRDGHTVFDTPPATMWDDAGATARVTVRTGRHSLDLLPDPKLLTGSHTRYPLVIDPDWHTFSRSDWTKVFRGTPSGTHWYGAGDVDTWAKVGSCNGWSFCGGVDVARSYWQFDTSFLNGKRLLSAEFDTTVVYGPSCNTRNYEIHLANGTINQGTNWSNAPTGALIDTSPAASDYTGCAGDKPLGFDIVHGINTTGWSDYYIQAQSETDQYAWRKLDATATRIIVQYNTRPSPPTDLATQPPLKACKWCGGTPYVGDDTMRLQGRLTDPDNDQLTAVWDVYGGPSVEHREGPTLGSGSDFSTDIDLRGRDGQHVSWTLWGRDPSVDGGDWKNGPGPFIVDRTGVDKPPGVTGGLYQDDNHWHGGAGVPGTFTFDAAGVTDIDHYLYGWSDPPSTQVDADALGGKATVTAAPPTDGPQDLYVQSVDRAGHRSPTQTLHLYVRPGNGPLAQWSLDGTAKDSAYLGDRDGTLNGGATYTRGAVGNAVALDGTDDDVTAPHTLSTTAPVTVSAWARLTAGGTAQTVVSQDGTSAPGFVLGYLPDGGGHWAFTMGTDTAAAAAAPQTGVWTQLTGVYDGSQLRLYVDGVQAATRDRTAAATESAGQVRIGADQAGHHFGGAVDEVTLYDRALTAAEIASALSRDDVQAGHWSLDETSGTTAGNDVAGGASGVLQGGARFVPDGAVNGAVLLDGPSAVVSTGAPAVRTDQSFTFSAWARLDHAPGGTDGATVLAQDGTVASAFTLGYRADPAGGRWELSAAAADAAGTGDTDSVVRSGPVAETGEWTQLTAVYDAAAGQLRLYVNGSLAGSGARTGGFDATGPFRMGRSLRDGADTAVWQGAIDDVRAYSRVLSDDEIRGLVSQAGVTQGDWKLDGNLQDSSPQGRHGTAVGTPAYTDGQSALPDPADLAVRLDGTQAVSAPHTVDIDRSFSVAAWARVDQAGQAATVLSEDGTTDSGFTLGARADGRWGATMFLADAPDNGTARDEAVGGSVQAGQWTHLVLVYDAGTRQLQLYVNGALAASTPHTQTYNVTGGLQIGRSKWGGAYVQYLHGAVDDAAAYARPLFAAEIQTMAGRDLSLVHDYRLDESSGTSAADAVGTHTGTLSGDASFGPGRTGNAVTLDGASGAVTTSGVDLRTDQAFTVSAWVRLDSDGCDVTADSECRADAVTLDGAHTSKFRLGWIKDLDHPFGAWYFGMPESDADGAAVTRAAVATLPSETDSWIHLAGVYDPATKKVWLYVNGTRVGDGTLNTPWQPAGGLEIGRGRTAGQPADYWPGGVDDIRLYTGALDKDKVSALFHSYPAQTASALPTADAAHWAFDENTGATAHDSSPRGADTTLQGAATWLSGRAGAAVSFDGKSGYTQTAGPVVDTGSSFSVAAWAYLDTAGGTDATVVGQDADRGSAFRLTYDGADKKWAISVPTSDTDGAPATLLTSAAPAIPSRWTHLVMSYDAQLHQVRLYVNGLLSGAQTGVTVQPSSGPATVGRGKAAGVPAAFFDGAVDDVRIYTKAVSEGEARRIHDDVGDIDLAFYRFDDGTAKDQSWRKNDATASSGVSWVAGVGTGKAVQLDGTSGVLTAPAGLTMLDSFTVSGWARLDRDDKAAAVVSQDGDRTSGYALQYRTDLKRWTFGAATADSDGAPQVYAASLAAPALHTWTYLTGVYDGAARQLRIYVDGKLNDTRDNVVLWPATGKVAIGRAKSAGAPTAFFPGALDEVRVGEGIVPDGTIAVRGGFGAAPAGELASFTNGAGDHYTGSTDDVRPGYHFDTALGLVAAPGDNTRTLYACATPGGDGFTSQQADCEGQNSVGTVGPVYTVPPLNIPTIPLYRCNSGPDHFESRDVHCAGQLNEGTLGYTVAYAHMTRYDMPGGEHASSVDGSPAGYRAEGDQGVVVLAPQDGTTALYDCRGGYDQTVSTDAGCGGQGTGTPIGAVWQHAPQGLVGQALYQCRVGSYDDFLSLDDACEGQSAATLLGYTLAEVPDATADFDPPQPPGTAPAATEPEAHS